SKVNIGDCPPATRMASKSATARSRTGRVSFTRAARRGVFMNPRLMRSEAEEPLASRGSLRASASHFPPSGLKISTSYPFSVRTKYEWVSSAHQKPDGHPVLVEMLGLAMTIATRFLLGDAVFGSLRLTAFVPPSWASWVEGSARARRHPLRAKRGRSAQRQA